MAQYTDVNQLYADVLKFMDRNESTLANIIPSFVNQAETELDRRLRHPAAEVIGTYTVRKGDNNIPAPTQLLELKSLRSRKTGDILYRRSYEVLYDVYNISNFPVSFASVANYYYLDKISTEDVSYEFIFYTAPEKLSNLNTTNFYLEVLPDFLLYNTLAQAFVFDGQPDQSQYWGGMAERVLSSLEEQIKRESYQGSTLVSWQNNLRNNFYYQ